MGSLSSFAADSSGALHEDPHINSYVRVERLDCKYNTEWAFWVLLAGQSLILF